MNEEKKQTALFTAGHFANDIGSSIVPPLLPLISQVLGLTYTLGGFLVATHQIIVAGLQPFFGYISDRRSSRLLAPLGILVSGVFMGLVGVAPTFPILLAIVAIAATGSALFHPVSAGIISLPGSSKRGTTMSLFMAGGAMGYAFGPLVVLALVALFDLKGTLLISIPALTIFIAVLRRGAPPFRSSNAGDFGQIMGLLRSRFRVLGPIMVAIVAREATGTVLFAFLPSYGVELGMSVALGGLLLFANLFASTAGTLIGGVLSDKHGRKIVVASSLLLTTPVLLAFLNTSGPLFWILIAVAGMALAASAPVTMIMLQEILPENRALASALHFSISMTLAGLATAFAGIGIDTIGFQWTFQITFVLPLVGGLAVAAMPRGKGNAP